MKKNIIPMILSHLQRIALFIMVPCLLLPAACTDQNDDLISMSRNDQSKMTIVITVPGTQLPTTRGMADGKGEESVEEIDILVFDRTASPEKLVEHVAVADADIQQSPDAGTDYKVVFKAALTSRATASRLVIVANAHNEVTAMLAAISQEKTKKEVMENLLFATTGTGVNRKWKAVGKSTGNPDGDFTPIPMYAEKEMEKIQSGTQIESINLVRMLARIDVLNSATSKFTLQKIHLVNYNLAGHIAPAWNTSDGKLLTTAPDEPYVPASSNAQLGATNALTYDYTHSATGYEGEIYTYESMAAKDGTTNDLGRKNATCLVLEGTMVGDPTNTPHFYRVDFATYQETITDPNNIPYIPLRRNHKYKVDIRAVEGNGYGSLSDALNSYTVVSNLKTRIIAYDQGVIKDVVYDGQYMLGVEKTEYVLFREKQEVKIKVFTDYPGGWKATIPDAAQQSPRKWLFLKGGGTSATGACGDSETSFTILLYDRSVYAPEPGDITATITLTAGRLTHKITVTQTDKSGLWIKITDENGNEIDRLEFVYFQNITKLKPKEVYITWGGVDELRFDRITSIFPFEFDDKYDKIERATGGYKKFTIKPKEDITIPTAERTMIDNYEFMLFPYPSDPYTYISAKLDLIYFFGRGRMSFPYVGAFWRWNQSGERLIQMNVPPGEWKAEVTEGADFIRLDTEQTADPNAWFTGRIAADMNLDENDAKYRLPATAKTKVGGTAKAVATFANTTNLYFRIGLTGNHPKGSAAGINGSEKPRYGKVVVTHQGPESPQTIYIRQGEAADELISGSNIYWSPYNMSDPLRGAGGSKNTDHNDVLTGEPDFMPKKFTDYPSQAGYFFQWNRVKAYHPNVPNGYSAQISGWPSSYEDAWSPDRDVCPKGYRHPKGKYGDYTSEYYTGILINPLPSETGYLSTENSMWGFYADGFSDRNYMNGGSASSTVDDSKQAYVGRLFFDPVNSASLFFPAAGKRNSSGSHSSSNGALEMPGMYAVYSYADKIQDVSPYYVGSTQFEKATISIGGGDRTGGYKIRCVKGEKQ